MPETENQARGSYMAVLVAAVSCYMALGAVLGMLPEYVPERLHGGAALVGLAVGAPSLTGLLGRPLGGRIADRLGSLTPLLAGATLMAIGALPAALTSSSVALLCSRLLVGFGEGIMMAANVLWLMRLAGPARQGRALGHIGLANYGGLALGPILATALGDVRAAGTILWIAAALPLLGATLALATIAASPAARSAARPGHHRKEGDAASDLLPLSGLVRSTAPAGVGLLLVNVGYVAVLSLGAGLARSRGTGLASLIVPTFAIVIIFARTFAGSVPDRLGGVRTAIAFATIEAIGLLVYAQTASAALAIVALLTLSAGQSMAVPGLGLLALSGVPPRQQGAAAGLFFAWFDAGVGIGGPALGAIASLTGSAGGIDAAAVAVALVVVIVLALYVRPALRRDRASVSRA